MALNQLMLFPVVSAGVVCSNECDGEIMCWGTGADKCVSCRNFLYIDPIIPVCPLVIMSALHSESVSVYSILVYLM